MTEAYSSYEIHAKLLRAVDVQQRATAQNVSPYGDLLGLYFDLQANDLRYFNTPIDVIPFARAGIDGIHFGFLTDFGRVNSLEEAFIVRVSPMDFEEPVCIAARNFADFLALLYYAPDALYSCSPLNQQKMQVALPKKTALHEMFFACFAADLRMPTANYFEQLKKARAAITAVWTADQIGVAPLGEIELGQQPLFPLTRNSEPSLADVADFFHVAPVEQRLAFIRDVQSFGILLHNSELKRFLAEQLHALHFVRERAALLAM